jgi:hypothetical protein
MMYATRILRTTCVVVVAGLGSLVLGSHLCAQTELDFIARRDSKVTGQVVAVGDFNGDRHQDLVTVQESTLSVLLGDEDGRFKAGRDARVGGAPVVYADFDEPVVAVGDFNRDGRQDLATANEDSGTVSVLLGRGDGSFRVARNFRVGGPPNSIGVADFNGDGRQDLATANGNAGTVSVLLGRGDGTFGARSFQVGGTPGLLTVGDFNGDGRQDVAVTKALGEGIISVLLGKGNGTFQLAMDTEVEEIGSIAAGDFNEDGREDLAVASSAGWENELSILLATGDGTFQVTPAGTSGGVFSVRTGDFNSDGHQDLAVAWIVFENVNGTDSSGLFIFLGQGDATFQGTWGGQTGGHLSFLTIGDFDGDGRQDLATENVSILLGHGDGSFEDAKNFPVGDVSYTKMVHVGDFNGDGRPDLATLDDSCTSFPCGVVGIILLNQGDGTFRTAGDFAVVQGRRFMAVGDFNADGRSDLVLFSGNTVSVRLSKGDGTFQDPKSFRVGGVPSSVTVGDFNGDRRQDLVIANSSGFGALGSVSIFLSKGDGTFQIASVLPSGVGPMTVDDFNGDGRQDLAIANSPSNSVSVLLGNGNGTFQVARNFIVGDQPGSIVVADFNGDGRQDLATSNSGSNTISILLGGGDGTFQPALTLEQGPGSMSAADFDGDGRQDLAVFNSGSRNVSILLGTGDGTFESAIDFGVGGPFTSGAVADFNGDGLPDLATDFVSILINNTGKAISKNSP